MQHGALYQHANGVQRRDAQQILAEYRHLFRWRPDGRDSLLDIGCGSGDVTVDFVLPIMPGTFGRVVGADLSAGMLRHARKLFAHVERLQFEQLDIGAPIEGGQGGGGGSGGPLAQPFDHITSFYCLHWVQNQAQAMRNVYDLLGRNGDCLLVLLATNPIFEVYKRLGGQTRWAPYMRDLARYISPYQYSKRPAEELGGMLYEAGFSEYSVQVLDRVFVYDGLEVLRRSVRAVSPFLDRMDAGQQEDFLDDYIACVRKMQLATAGSNDSPDCQFNSPYKLLVAYARK